MPNKFYSTAIYQRPSLFTAQPVGLTKIVLKA